MTEVAGPVVEARRPPWWLMLLYALPVLSAFALATLLVGDALAAYETDEDHGADLHHLFVFDLAWPFFLASTALTLLAGIGSLIAGMLGREPRLRRYGAIGLTWCAVAIATVAVAVATGLT